MVTKDYFWFSLKFRFCSVMSNLLGIEQRQKIMRPYSHRLCIFVCLGSIVCHILSSVCCNMGNLLQLLLFLCCYFSCNILNQQFFFVCFFTKGAYEFPPNPNPKPQTLNPQTHHKKRFPKGGIALLVKKFIWFKRDIQNPAHRIHWISQYVWIIALIPKKKQKKNVTCAICHLSPVT